MHRFHASSDTRVIPVRKRQTESCLRTFLVTAPHRLSDDERASIILEAALTYPNRMPPKAAMTQLMMTYPVTRASISICNNVIRHKKLFLLKPVRRRLDVHHTTPAAAFSIFIEDRPKGLAFCLSISARVRVGCSPLKLPACFRVSSLESRPFAMAGHVLLPLLKCYRADSSVGCCRDDARCSGKNAVPLKGLTSGSATVTGKFVVCTSVTVLNRCAAFLNACSRPERRIMYYISCPAGLRSASNLECYMDNVAGVAAE